MLITITFIYNESFLIYFQLYNFRPLPVKVEVRGLDVLTQEQYLLQALWEKNSPQPTVLATNKNFRINFSPPPLFHGYLIWKASIGPSLLIILFVSKG